jgi:N utilization substance protein B
MSTNTRHQAREMAFQYLYSHTQQTSKDGITSEAARFEKVDFGQFCINFGRTMDDFSWELVDGTGKKIPSLDETIGKLSTNWRLERMPKVDLAILRLAAYEILFRPDIPKSVSINEAVELAKAFGAEESPSFINGILDKLQKPT